MGMKRVLVVAAVVALVGAAPARAVWPLWPVDRQHPVRGGFLDPRWAGPKRGWIYHAAVDVAAREDVPTGAPAGFVRRVFAIEPGKVLRTTISRKHPCGRVRIGQVTYGHVGRLQVAVGRPVRARRWIGWTCRGSWHVHITEFDHFDRKVNPFRPGGVLQPLEDTAPPVIKEVRVVDGELRARIEDAQSFRGWFDVFPRLYNDLVPYRIALDGVTRRVFALPPSAPFERVYAPETFRNIPARQCLRRTGPCNGQSWFRLGRPRAGSHVIEAWDANGNLGRLDVVID